MLSPDSRIGNRINRFQASRSYSRKSHHSRTPISLNSTRQESTTAPFCSGSAERQELSSLPLEAVSMSSQVDLVPSNSMLPFNMPQSELTESLLVTVVNQFGLMQRQMFDQFQQAMAMMVQMFGTMHQDQMEVIRAELDRLHELTDEFHALKNELAERTREKTELRPREPELNSTRLDQLTAVELKNPATVPWPSGWTGSSQDSQVGRAPAPSRQSPTSRTIGQQSSPDSRILSTQRSLSSPTTNSISEPLMTDSQASEKLSDTGPLHDSNQDTVLWLHQRIMVLQRERESRWQRILKLMPGMSSS